MTGKNKTHLIKQKVAPGFERTLAHLDNLLVAVCKFTNGPAATPGTPHSHIHEQITYVAEGELLFYLDEKEILLKQGDLITIPPDVPHCIRILSSTVILVDSFSPVRMDFLT